MRTSEMEMRFWIKWVQDGKLSKKISKCVLELNEVRNGNLPQKQG